MTKKEENLPVNSPGKKWAVAVYKDENKDDHIIHDESEWIEIHDYPEGEVLGSAWVAVEKVIQVKQYEPLKITMGASIPCRREEIMPATKEVFDIITKQFSDRFREIKEKVESRRK